MLIAICHILSTDEMYKDQGSNFYNQFNKERKAGMMKDMNDRGVVVNTAYLVPASFVIGDHLAFQLTVDRATAVSGRKAGGRRRRRCRRHGHNPEKRSAVRLFRRQTRWRGAISAVSILKFPGGYSIISPIN